MNVLIIAFWLMLPAYIPNNCAVLFGGGMPLDMGQTFQDGQRTLGDGKTFRGTIAGTVCGVLMGLLQNQIAPLIGLPSFGIGFEQLPILLALALGAMLGDIVAAFFKRRLGTEARCTLFRDRPDRLRHWSLAVDHDRCATVVLAKLYTAP